MPSAKAEARLATEAPHQRFTLIEISVWSVVVALLLGSLLVPLSTQVEQRRVAEAAEDPWRSARGPDRVRHHERTLYPAPAQSPSDGLERDTCANSGEALHWPSSLGRRSGCRLLSDLSASISATALRRVRHCTHHHVHTPSARAQTVQTRDGATTPTLVSGVPAVILSHGANNFGVNENGTELDNASGTNVDEVANNSKFKCATTAVPATTS